MKIIVTTIPSMICFRIKNSFLASGKAVSTENNMLMIVPATVIYTVMPNDCHSSWVCKICVHEPVVNSTGTRNTFFESAATGELNDTARRCRSGMIIVVAAADRKT